MKTLNALLAAVLLGTVLTAGTPAQEAAAVIPAQPDTAAEYYSEFDSLPDDKWFGADNTQTVVLPDGRILWVFADTLKVPGPWDHNSFVIQGTDGSFSVINQPIKNAANGEYFWPIRPVVQGAYLHITTSRVVEDRTNPDMPFRVVGTTIETFSATTLKWLFRTNVPTSQGIEWTASFYEATGFYYIWGSKHNFLGHDIFVARVPKSVAFTDVSYWRYWNGTGWATSESLAAPNALRGEMDAGWSILPLATGGYGLITKSNGFLADDINLYTSSTLQGTWTKKKLIVKAPKLTPDNNRYNISIHRWAKLASGKLLLSVNNGAGLATMNSDPRTCRPSFFEVTL